ncbi:peptide-methionine (S)-S-oxide reductase MsrA [uncultured Solobacterium sp.]|uniref:peptide-methionine (S)-S-oxide reductase MsrA n=1 Tax=uncultured Solobacterium sp. TaxID=747375 RepID=UPI0028E38F4F|nr:peptide-methionine (S)-S-oxide reductase MsrA [uncultured Solobacterium sp.]
MKIFEQFPQYEDGFIVLRRFVQEDAKYLSEVYEERLTKRQAEKTIENYEKSYHDKDEVILGIFGKEDEQLKGIIEIYDIHESELSIGYMIVEKYRHQTYAKNSVYLLTKKLIEDYGITCIHANCHVDNIYSIRVLEHNGYERLGQEEDEYVYAYKPKQLEQDTFNQDEKMIVLAGGCFWGVEKAFKALDGVLETTVGYANGFTDNPTYEEVCRNETGYKEAVKVVYQPNVVSLSIIIRAFFLCIDPRQRNRQGNDIGSQYQAGIYYVDEKDLDDIKPVYTNERMKYDRFFVELEPLKNFYTAEEYHQDYLDKHPNGYCHITAFKMEEVKKLNQQPCQIKVILPSEKELTLEVPKNTTIAELLQEVNTEHRIYAALINHKHVHFSECVHDQDVVQLQDIRASYGNTCYQSTLTLLYLKAIHDVMGKNVTVTIANSLSKGLFTVIHAGNVTDDLAKEIETRMHELVEENLEITEEYVDHDTAIELLKDAKDKKSVDLLNTASDLKNVYVITLADEKMMTFVHALPSTSYIPFFEVRRYRNGLLLRFPHPNFPDQIPPYEEQKLLYDAFSEETQWEKLLKVSFASDLNRMIEKKESKDLIMLSEALHEKKIAMIAEQIQSAKKRIILIAGPSSSGKTTFAKRLCIQLKVIGLNPLYLGTDDYFVNRDEMIPDENGKYDFEALEAVDLNLFETQMNALLHGEKVDLPEFDFITGKKVFGKRIISIDASQPIVIEGIHGLNPQLTEGIDDSEKFKIYISPLTQINLDAHHRIPTTDARMLRRMVRDNRTRGRDGAVTISSWSSVRHGEEKYIFPFNKEADVFFNSQCVYELAVLKKYATPLLEKVQPDQAEYAEAQRMLQFLSCFVSIDDDSMIANNSIIREFIGGSILVS